ncbi:YjgN family protein [Litoreibacter arenae]|uniref:Thymidylate kinase n=1 Tax=Litoreibacter arenae DSM 19593 TaxID=1123360 RepID=S9RH96_9RHOB|nr:YjgN family protein [Litoreibacter arenae]EPX77460.1 Thymidylate kinase [Litoreibacter arenae DSM 19593]
MSESLPVGAKPFEFTGNAKEWFGIWIVNLLLSIVTLGIYSAWAKVRHRKYFYGNTYVEGRNFDYHATGKQILIGRLIIIGVYVLLNVLLLAVPPLGWLMLVVLIFAYPWLIVRGMLFNARMSSFSNVRFGFIGTTGRAFLVFLVYPILMTLTLFTTFPIWDRALKRFSVDNHKLGQATFKLDVNLSAFYMAFLWAIGFVVLVNVIGTLLLYFVFHDAVSPTPDGVQNLPVLILIQVLFFAAFLPAAFIYQALTRNAVYNNTTLQGGHRFASNVTAPKLLWIAVSNMVVVICTLFLMLPWAQVRIARYLADHTGLIPGGSLDDFVSQQQEAGGAFGDAYADLEGIDVGLPI